MAEKSGFNMSNTRAQKIPFKMFFYLSIMRGHCWAIKFSPGLKCCCDSVVTLNQQELHHTPERLSSHKQHTKEQTKSYILNTPPLPAKQTLACSPINTYSVVLVPRAHPHPLFCMCVCMCICICVVGSHASGCWASLGFS